MGVGGRRRSEWVGHGSFFTVFPSVPCPSPSPATAPGPAPAAQVDLLLGRMQRTGARFSGVAVSRLTAFCLTRGQPKVAFTLFKASARVPGRRRAVHTELREPGLLCAGMAGGFIVVCDSSVPLVALSPRSFSHPLPPLLPARCLQKVRDMGLLSLEPPSATAGSPDSAAAAGSGAEQVDRGASSSSSSSSRGGVEVEGGSDSEVELLGREGIAAAASSFDNSISGSIDLGLSSLSEGEVEDAAAAEEEDRLKRAAAARHQARGQAAFCYCRMIAACHKAR